MRQEYPIMMIITSRLAARFERDRHLLYRVAEHWKDRKFDISLLELFRINLPCSNCPHDLIAQRY